MNYTYYLAYKKMFFRLGRALSNFSKQNTSQVVQESAEIEYQKVIKVLENKDNYTPEKAKIIIKNYFLLHSNNLKLGKNINWASNQVLRNSLEKIFSIIDSLGPGDIFLLISNLRILRIKNEEYWEILQEKFIQNISEINAKNIPSYALSFSHAKIKNAHLWNLIEQKIMSEVYPDYQFVSKGVCQLYKALGDLRIGSDDLRKNLEKNAKNLLNELTVEEIIKILIEHSIRKSIDPDFFELSLKKISDSIDNCDRKIIINALEISVSLGAQEKYIKQFEKCVLESINEMKISDFVLICNCYGKLDENRRSEERKEFIAKIEKNYMARRDNLLEKAFYNMVLRQVRIFWGFAKNNVCSNEKIWKDYLEILANVNDYDIDLALKGPVEELKEFGKGRNLI
ncbi:hypothetical protein SteCoe_1421 [Stentor coeruleus]|uniref:Uncharacterized protein n=1 Tax=Stentor coeruleus TaxID=5963 RepID=A0A1R2D1T0_9CILI|nr:hypothetical protein SteCoe_1421 [Stentor coeruleus]